MMRISAIVERFRAEGLLVDFSPGQTDLFDRTEFDSREVGSATCFVAIRGHQADGHSFIDKAVNNGAVAIVCEAAPDISREGLTGAAVVHVRDSRMALLHLASMQAGHPADRLTLVGTTGTNGKTTVATLIRHVLDETGMPCGFIGTTEYRVGSTTYRAHETTPSPMRTYALFAEMEQAGCVACSMEVSSHALDQWRVNVADFDVAVFTNLTRDHLDYHRTEEAYLLAKKKLFDGLKATSTAVINLDDSAGRHMMADTNAAVITYGMRSEADIRYTVDKETVSGLTLTIDGSSVQSKLAGRFNGANLTAAYAAGLGMGVDPVRLRTVLQQAPSVPGRFEMIHGSRQRTVIVDYAHTPDALENTLRAARRLTPEGSSLWCVFGCGGDRDAGKRPIMGRIAEKLADRVIVTSDNPRSESPQAILADIEAGMRNATAAEFEVDRRSAIGYAAGNSSAGDVVVIAGKGHETVQILGDTIHHFDDVEEANVAFETTKGLEETGRG